MGELLGRLVDRGTALGESRFLMARAELTQDLELRVRRLAMYAGATVLFVFGLQFLVVSGFLALLAVLDAWLAALIVSVASLIAGTALLVTARSRAGAGFLVKTLEALREDLQWFRSLLR